MSLNHKTTWLVAWLLIMLAGVPAAAQDMQPFGPTQNSPYGGGPRPNEGFFFSVDAINWAISTPDLTPVGFPNLTRSVWIRPSIPDVQSNTLDNGELKSDLNWGERLEFGRIDGHDGWLLSAYFLRDHTQTITASGVDMVFQDLQFGAGQRLLYGPVWEVVGHGIDPLPYLIVPPELRDLPLTFDDVTIDNKIETWGVEWMFVHRLHPSPRGGIFEIFAGVRYLEFDEQFNFLGTGDRYIWDNNGHPIGAGTILADSFWNTEAENHVIGPQVGIHASSKRDRWSLSSEARFFAGFNYQNIRQRGVLGSLLNEPFPNNIISAAPLLTPYEPLAATPVGFNHVKHDIQWSPALELRLDAKFQLTRALSIKGGYTVLWIDGLARASNITDYTVSETQILGIQSGSLSEDVFVHGWNIGIEVNR